MVLLEPYNTTPGGEDPRSVSPKRIQVLKCGQNNSSPEVRTRRLKYQSADNPDKHSTMAGLLPTFPPFQVHLDGNVDPRWKKWLARFENLIVGMGIEDAKQKHALLLHYSGPEDDGISTRLKTPAKTKITRRPWKNLPLTSFPKSTQFVRSTTSEKLSKTKTKVSTVSTQDSEFTQRPGIFLQIPESFVFWVTWD